MPKLKIYIDKEMTQEIHGDTIDAGRWNLEQGSEIKLYVKNPSDFLTAKFIKSGHSDPRTILRMPETIAPEQVAEITIGIPPVELRDEDEDKYFEDLFEQLNGEIEWSRI